MTGPASTDCSSTECTQDDGSYDAWAGLAYSFANFSRVVGDVRHAYYEVWDEPGAPALQLQS